MKNILDLSEEIKGVDDEAVQDSVCEYCNTYVIKEHPPGFVCEGRFCDEAWDKWLEDEWEDEIGD